jgi:hypothetical protein
LLPVGDHQVDSRLRSSWRGRTGIVG